MRHKSWLRGRGIGPACLSKPRHKPQSQSLARPSWKTRRPCMTSKIAQPAARDSGAVTEPVHTTIPPLCPDILEIAASSLPCLRLAFPLVHGACQMIASSVPSDNGRRDPACLVTGQQVRPDGIEDIFTSLMTRTSPAFISLYRTRTRTISPVIQFYVRAHTQLQARGLEQLDSLSHAATVGAAFLQGMQARERASAQCRSAPCKFLRAAKSHASKRQRGVNRGSAREAEVEVRRTDLPRVRDPSLFNRLALTSPVPRTAASFCPQSTLYSLAPPRIALEILSSSTWMLQ